MAIMEHIISILKTLFSPAEEERCQNGLPGDMI